MTPWSHATGDLTAACLLALVQLVFTVDRSAQSDHRSLRTVLFILQPQPQRKPAIGHACGVVLNWLLVRMRLSTRSLAWRRSPFGASKMVHSLERVWMNWPLSSVSL